MLLWGHERNLDYWTALERGEVDDPERRAIALLRRYTDPERFGLYCVTGELAVRGNLTGTMYVLDRTGRVLELEDGREVATWCVYMDGHIEMPLTDNVLTLRAIIEGEELAFLRTGNRSPGPSGGRFQRGPATTFVGVRNPHTEPFLPAEVYDLPGAFPRLLGTEEILDMERLRPNDWQARPEPYLVHRPRRLRRGRGRPRQVHGGCFGGYTEQRIKVEGDDTFLFPAKDEGNKGLLHGPPVGELHHYHDMLAAEMDDGNECLLDYRPPGREPNIWFDEAQDDPILGFPAPKGNRAVLGLPEEPEPRELAYVTAPPMDPETEDLRRRIQREVLREVRGAAVPDCQLGA